MHGSRRRAMRCRYGRSRGTMYMFDDAPAANVR